KNSKIIAHGAPRRLRSGRSRRSPPLPRLLQAAPENRFDVMTLHGLTAPGACGRLDSGSESATTLTLFLQRFQHARPMLEFHVALQQQELRDFLPSRTLLGLRG